MSISLLTLLLLSGSGSPDPLEFLLASAATDFHQHQPPEPARFRKVRLGHYPAPDGSKQFLLCGEFQPTADSGPPIWIAFATIRTSDYEQWLGLQADSWCKRSDIRWDAGDWSMDLQERYQAQR
jgi:hypothetical protein